MTSAEDMPCGIASWGTMPTSCGEEPGSWLDLCKLLASLENVTLLLHTLIKKHWLMHSFLKIASTTEQALGS